MTADCRNSGVVDFASSFGSAVLGTLKYDDDKHNWLLKFRNIVARYQYLWTYRERDLQDQACLKDLIKCIYDISSKRMTGFHVSSRIEIGNSVTGIRTFVKAIHKEESYALFIIAGCLWYLGKSHQLTSGSRHRNQLKHAARGYLRDLSTSCSDISINHDVLLAKLN